MSAPLVRCDTCGLLTFAGAGRRCNYNHYGASAVLADPSLLCKGTLQAVPRCPDRLCSPAPVPVQEQETR